MNNKFKKTAKVTDAQAELIVRVITQDLVMKGKGREGVYFQKTKNYQSYADTLNLRGQFYANTRTFFISDRILDGREFTSLFWKCPLRVFTTKQVTDYQGKNRREELHIDYAAVMLHPKGAELLATATKLAQTTLSK